ncbi:MAG: YkgJ family cysteine cluster protein [Pseudomonas sp.]|nr:YkgJ family cysteine cluster protein [Pseudomonas sp.]
MNTSFTCVGCGKCCRDHHVPLTLVEARDWARSGGNVIVLAEAFLANGLGISESQREHALRRSAVVRSGNTDLHLAITFAAFNPGACRNLDSENLCTIYDTRPLVCRIYPMEINPHIPLNPSAKECPPESWESGTPLIVGSTLVDLELAQLIERSRQADRDDIGAKVAICERLGIQVTALKGDGFTAYLPDMAAFSAALQQVEPNAAPASNTHWTLHLSGPDVAQQVQSQGALATVEGAASYTFIPLRAA